jgi:hypothetical protein
VVEINQIETDAPVASARDCDMPSPNPQGSQSRLKQLFSHVIEIHQFGGVEYIYRRFGCRR